MEFKPKMESWDVPPKSSFSLRPSKQPLLFTPAPLGGERGARGEERWRSLAVALPGNPKGWG